MNQFGESFVWKEGWTAEVLRKHYGEKGDGWHNRVVSSSPEQSRVCAEMLAELEASGNIDPCTNCPHKKYIRRGGSGV